MNVTVVTFARAGRGFARLGNLILAAMCLLLLAESAAAQVSYHNPVIPGDHPDPSIIRVGKEFWSTCTSSEWAPEFPLMHSTDLVNWELTGAVFAHRPIWAEGNFWAPEISEYKGHFAVYYVARKKGGPLAVAVATADAPGGPYLDHGPLIAQPDGSIDPVPTVDENGKRYLLWKEDGNSRSQPTPIWAQPLNEEGTRLMGEPHELIRNDVDWEGGVVEGPYVLRRNGWFYLFYSGNGCCGTGCHYALGVARSRALLGPWVKNPSNPILAANDTWKCPGHGSVVEDGRGRYFFLYHAYSTGGSIFTGREGMLDEIQFGLDDWPTMNDGKGPSVTALSPFGVPQQQKSLDFTTDFGSVDWSKDWQWPQAGEPGRRIEDGHLVLSVNRHSTNLLGAVLARSTTATDYVATTAIESEFLKPGWAAGLCAFGDADNAIGAVIQDGQVVTWRRHQGETRELSRQPAPTGAKAFLRLTANHGYHFEVACSADGRTWKACGGGADAQDLPPWDRSVRAAITVGGATDAQVKFDSFSLRTVKASGSLEASR